jgi:Chalcone isomerase-like
MHLQRRHLLMLLALPAAGAAAQVAAPAEVGALWPQARLVGSGRLRYMGFRVYDSRLWSPAALTADSWAGQPFALELVYARALQGALIASRSLVEMRRQGQPDEATSERWLAAMTASFPDVKEGDRLTGVHLPADGARIFHNGSLKGEWREQAFARQFFGIWLSPQTSEPALREALLGGRA